jgi:hypothetical protein
VDENEQQEEQQSQGHPAWQAILEKLPDDLQPLVRPELENWDKGVQGKLQEVRSQYEGFDPYKPLIENNIPMERVEQALWLAQQLDQNPQGVVDQAIKAFDLQYAPVTAKNSNPSQDDDEYEFGDDDEYEDTPKPRRQASDPLAGLENHPAFQQIKEKAEQLDQLLSQQRQEQEQEEASTQLEGYLSELKQTHGEFDDLYVTALMANGMEAEEAIERYKNTITSQAQALYQQHNQGNQSPPPVVMGEDGTSGSGMPVENTRMGALKQSQVDDIVLQMLNGQSDT